MDINFNGGKPGKITRQEDIPFSLKVSGLYLIELTARTQGEKQLGTSDDEDLRVEIDGRKFPQLKNPERYFDSPASFSGGQLHGLKKTVVFILLFDSGKHTISLIPDISATVEQVKVSKISNFENNKINLVRDITAEDGDRRPWITLALVDLGLKDFSVDLTLKKRFIDSDDVKVVIDGEVKRNYRSILHKLWYFAASVLISEKQTEVFTADLSQGIHYLELWADRMPVLNSVVVNLKKPDNKIKKYQDNKFNRDYNQLDGYIIGATDFWNNFFLKQEYSPPELLDPSLVKAIVYRESRLGYYPDENIIDVIQVWDPANPAKDAILGKTPANEFINPNRIGHISYSYPHGRTSPAIENSEDSIFWGVRWLYHKAQYLLEDNNGALETPYIRKWRSWEEAVRSYNANPKIIEEYIKEVFSVYEKGIDLEGNVLW